MAANPSSSGVGASGAEAALKTLRQRFAIGPAVRGCDPLLSAYLAATGLDPDAAVAKIERRRHFERTLVGVTMAPSAVAALHSTGVSVSIVPPREAATAAGEPSGGLDAAAAARVVVHLAPARVPRHGGTAGRHTEYCTAVAFLEMLASVVAVLEAPLGAPGSTLAGRGSRVQVAVVVDAAESNLWVSHDSTLHRDMATIINKYYPTLVNSVILVNWPLNGPATSALTTPKKKKKAPARPEPITIQDAVAIVPRSLLPPHLQPPEIEKGGGVAPVRGASLSFSGHALADAVAYHWFALTAKLRLPSDAARPAWVALPRVALLPEGLVAALGGDTRTPPPQHHPRTPTRPELAFGGASSRKLSARRSRGDWSSASGRGDDTDDGQCSMVTDGDLVFDESSAAASPAVVTDTGGFDNDARSIHSEEDDSQATTAMPASPAKFKEEEEDSALVVKRLRAQLADVVARRKKAEALLVEKQRGLDPATTACPELATRVRDKHHELNALVAGVAIRGSKAHGDVTLPQLVDELDRTILAVVAGAGCPEIRDTDCLADAKAVTRKQQKGCSVQ